MACATVQLVVWHLAAPTTGLSSKEEQLLLLALSNPVQWQWCGTGSLVRFLVNINHHTRHQWPLQWLRNRENKWRCFENTCTSLLTQSGKNVQREHDSTGSRVTAWVFSGSGPEQFWDPPSVSLLTSCSGGSILQLFCEWRRSALTKMCVTGVVKTQRGLLVS